MLVALAVPACLSTERSEVEPGIGLYLDEATPTYAFVPGTSVNVYVSWTAWCTTDGPLADTSTTEPCDEQDFTARVTCGGAPCEIDPPAASSGVALNGGDTIRIVAPSPGDLMIDVVIEHAETHEQLARRGQIAIRNIDRLVIDCIHQPYDPNTPRCVQREGYVECRDVPWVACPARTTVDPAWGTPVSMWVYGEGGGLPIATTTTIPVEGQPLRPRVEFSGLTLNTTDYVHLGHADDAAAAVASMFWGDLESAGTLLTTAQQRALVTETAMALTAP